MRQCKLAGVMVLAKRSDSEHRRDIDGSKRPTTLRQLRDMVETKAKQMKSDAKDAIGCGGKKVLSAAEDRRLKSMLVDITMRHTPPFVVTNPGSRGLGGALLRQLTPAERGTADSQVEVPQSSMEEMKQWLRLRGLPTCGKKDDLKQRMQFRHRLLSCSL